MLKHENDVAETIYTLDLGGNKLTSLDRLQSGLMTPDSISLLENLKLNFHFNKSSRTPRGL